MKVAKLLSLVVLMSVSFISAARLGTTMESDVMERNAEKRAETEQRKQEAWAGKGPNSPTRTVVQKSPAGYRVKRADGNIASKSHDKTSRRRVSTRPVDN